MLSSINLSKVTLIFVTIALIVYTSVTGTHYAWFGATLLQVVVVVGSLPLMYEIVNSVLERRFGVDFIALAAIVSSLYIGEIAAAGIVLFMMSGGEYLEKYAEGKARTSLKNLLEAAPQFAHVLRGTVVTKVPISEVVLGDLVVVSEKEILPIDGIVLSGESECDESSITGEPLPRQVVKGDKVWSGSVNQTAAITVRATSDYAQSTFATLVRLVEQAEKDKAPLVTLADKFSVFFTVVVFAIAYIAWLKDPKLAVAVLVVATPCPLLLAAPIAFISGMSKAAKEGVIVKRGRVFEIGAQISAFIFDKTGTLTKGAPTVDTILPATSDIHPSELLRIAATLEQYSTHILADSIVNEAKKQGMELAEAMSVDEVFGKGVVGSIDGRVYHVGREEYMREQKIQIGESLLQSANEQRALGEAVTFVADEKSVLGSISFTDRLRENSKEVLAELRAENTNAEFILATGDTLVRAGEIGKELGFTRIEANCLPEKKLTIIKDLEGRGMRTMMMGDGVNDAPSLAEASLGVALGNRGQNAATDAADVVITVDDISKITRLISISRRTVSIAKQSMIVGMGLSFVAMGFAYMGHLPPVYGAMLQEGIDVLVILNALRALR
jgi:heavy metal translocating P-type ATPase